MKKFKIFFSICFCLSYLSAVVFRVLGLEYNSIIGSLYATVYMLFPLISVVITQIITKEKLFSGIGFSFKLNWWWLFGLLVMPLMSLAAMFMSSLMPGASFTVDSPLLAQSIDAMKAQGLPVGPWGFMGVTLVSALFAACTINAVFAFGEEAAWRGFLSDCLEGMGFWKKSLVVGFVWGLWHMPIILMGHNYPTHPFVGVFMMVVFCMLVAPLMQLIRDKSGSSVAAAIAHGSINATAGLSLAYISGFNDLLCGMTGLAGFIVFLVADAAILICMRRSN